VFKLDAENGTWLTDVHVDTRVVAETSAGA